MKTCRICHVTKPLTEFHARPRWEASDGHRTDCMECYRAKKAAYRAEHRESINAYAVAYRAEHRASINAKKAAYQVEHRESINIYAVAYRAEHRESLSAKAAKWYAENGEKVRRYAQSGPRKTRSAERQARRRAMEAATATEIVSFEAILERYGMVCHICGERIVSRPQLHFDHVVPLALGGPHVNGNIRPSHAVCNLRKGARLLEGVA